MSNFADMISHTVDHDAAAEAQKKREARPSRNALTVTPSPVLMAFGAKLIEMDKEEGSPMVASLRYMRGNGGVNADGTQRLPNDAFWIYLFTKLSEVEGLSELIALEGYGAPAVDENAVKRASYDDLLAQRLLTEKQHATAIAGLTAKAVATVAEAPVVTEDLDAAF